MERLNMKWKYAVLAVSASLSACGVENAPRSAAPDSGESIETALMEQLLGARPGDVIDIPEGVFSFDRSLSLTVDDVTIRGQGMEKTVLSFKNQIAGAEGLLVTASNFTIEDLAIEDAKGDALKVNEGDTITIRRVRTEWTNGPDTANGAYGIYPVQTTNVLIEESVAIGASDAGIYVGQSRDVVVRNNRAEFNVAGFEIENTVNADVYGNVATNNTGGVLVFNMPHLEQEGYGTRVFNNDIYENNYRNFGHPGTPVASVPAGTGVIVNSNDSVEIFDNRIRDNNTSNIIISSLFTTGYSEAAMVDTFDPYPESIYIYGNEFSGGGAAPGTEDLNALRTALFGADGNLPDILWDGFIDTNKLEEGVMPNELRICLNNGDAQMLNADSENGAANPQIVTQAHQCSLEKLPPVSVAQLR